MDVMRSLRVDLIVLDILMPTMDGLEVIRAVKQSHAHIRVPGISSGGKRAGAAGYLETARVFGADEVMVKPLRISSFAPTVERLLASSGRADSPWADPAPVHDGPRPLRA